MRVLFIYLPHPYLARPESHAPLGLMYLAGILEQQNIDTGILNYTASSTEEAIENLPPADIYGITVTSLELLQANRFGRCIKNKYPEAIVGLGGPGTFTDEYVDFETIDFICKGDGEITILEILNDVKNGKLRKIYVGKNVSDLNKLPFPARHHLSSGMGSEIFNYNRNIKGVGSTLIEASRGCPFQCTFCSAPGVYKQHGGMRYRNPASVRAEIEHVIKEFNIRQFKFCDDIFTLNKTFVLEICEELGPLDIAWKANARTKPFDIDLANAMKDAGCEEIAFGVESFDNDVLKMLDKHTTNVDNAKALEIADKVDLNVRVLFMIRTPGQTSNTVPTNIEWLEKVPYDMIACTNFVPIPGSDSWLNPDKYNIEILNKNLDDYNFYFYGTKDGEENNIKDIIKIKDRSLEDLNRETIEFRSYLDCTGKVNRG